MRSGPSPLASIPIVSPAFAAPAARALRVLPLLVALAILPFSGALAQSLDDNLWVTNGQVNAVVRDGGTVYLGGNFTLVGPPTGGGAAVDAATGLLPAIFPKVEGIVYAVAPDGAGGWFLGGEFSMVGGLMRSNLAHLDSSRAVTSWNPGANGIVRALAVGGVWPGTIVYAGGDFTSVGSQPRGWIAAVSGLSGSVIPWNPNANGRVLALTTSGGPVFVGGDFTSIGGLPRDRIAALDPATALATSWNPGADGSVEALLQYGSTLYAGGTFSTIGGSSRSRIAAIIASGPGLVLGWNPGAGGAAVHALERVDDYIYAGGSFSTMAGLSRSNLAKIDAITGDVSTWNPNPNGPVHTLAFAPTQLFVGGDFTTIGASGGSARNYVARVDTGTANATSWNPNANGAVRAIGPAGPYVYVGGLFSSVNNLTRNRIAAFDAATGAATAWNPNASAVVHALAVSGSKVYAAGGFTTIGGQPRNQIAALYAASGLATPWNPDAGNKSVYALAIRGSMVYAGGGFTSIGGQPRNYIAALDTATGQATAWNPTATSQVRCLAVSGSTVYAGGFFAVIGGQNRNYLAAIDSATGLATAWNPNPNNHVLALAVSGSTVYAGGEFTAVGDTRNHIAAISAVTGSATAWNPNANNTVYSLVASGSVVYAGGTFTSIGGSSRNQIAALEATSGAAAQWSPDPNGAVRAIALHGSTVYAGGDFTAVSVAPASLAVGVPKSHVVAIGAPFLLVAALPASGGNTGVVTVTVAGNGIQTGATAMLSRSGEPDIGGNPVVVAPDGSSLAATFDLAGAEPGAWDVTVTNPDEQVATLAGGFTITALATPQVRVDVVGPDLIRANRPVAYDLVLQNEGNVDAEAVPLWITGIPAGATLELDFPRASPAQEAGEPDWSQTPLTLTSAGGQYAPLVIPRIAPGTVTRRVWITVPSGTPAFALGAAVAPAWEDRAALRTCLYEGGVIEQAQCMGARLTAIEDTLRAHPEIAALGGVGVWAKVAWQCEGAGTLPAAVAKAEEVLDHMAAAIEEGTAAGVCGNVLLPRWRDTLTIAVVFSIDPNDKLGPHGTISREQAIPYSIRFENLVTATAPAQQVVIVDALDVTKVDPATASLDAITFGDVRILPPPGLSSYATEVDLRPGTDLIVRVNATVDRFTGVLVWAFTSIDPATGQPPANPLAGFLPPNVTPPEGEGSVLFTVRAASVGGGDFEVRNEAVIHFDGDALTTPEWANVVDNTPPASAVLPLPSPSDSARFTVRWAGAGEDLRDYTVYVKEDAGEYRVWRQNTQATADTFVSMPGGHQYAFYSVARDLSGNVEPSPAAPDAQTQSPVAVEAGRAGQLALEGARPNPALGWMQVRFTLANRERATLDVIDVAGRRVLRREVGELGPGRHSVALGAPALRPGLYFLKLAQGSRALHARAVLMR